jgi:hypothetical protein
MKNFLNSTASKLSAIALTTAVFASSASAEVLQEADKTALVDGIKAGIGEVLSISISIGVAIIGSVLVLRYLSRFTSMR